MRFFKNKFTECYMIVRKDSFHVVVCNCGNHITRETSLSIVDGPWIKRYYYEINKQYYILLEAMFG